MISLTMGLWFGTPKNCFSDQTYETGDTEEEGFFSKLKKRIFGSSDAR